MNVDTAVHEVTRLGLDTSVFIYLVEEHPKYLPVVEEIIRRIAPSRLEAVTSVVTLHEVLVQPYSAADLKLAQRYRDILLQSTGLTVREIDVELAVKSAHLRSRYRLRVADALQLTAALEAGCEAFLTNDKDLRRVQELRVLLLDELEP